MYSVALVASLLAMAGVIAFIGDRVGRRVGRRRLTLFGLRPRHTSVVVTVLTGIIIAGASLGILAAVSGEVRTAIFRIDEIQRMLAQNRSHLRALQQQLDERQAALVEATKARDAAVRQRDAAFEEQRRAEQELAAARAVLAQVQSDLQRSRSELETAQERLEETRKNLSFQTARVRQLEQLGETLAGRVQELQQQVASLEQTEQQLSEAILALWNTAQRLQYGNVVFRRDEILLSAVLTSQGDAKAAEAQLLDFLKRVEAAAQARAGIPPSDGKSSDGTAAASGGIVRLLPKEFDDGVQLLASGRGTWVVRARVDRNTLAGEPVVVHIELVPRSLAFRAGQTVTEGRVDPSEGRIEDQVLELLRQANEVAIRYGSMVTGPDGTVGKLVSADEFVRVVAQLQQLNRPATVRAIAVRDTYNTEGPLVIHLEVLPGGASGS
ncbi:DUF3084 domain-containing protein [Carboxydochorda subterranea]|uniref:DUF3084 domain-containing protein n=1 Tax=Carboxydichorda subterranea TaxID=3109565 RepID=A0ABZ1BWQ3_9FIRM|nr:DUF3084 domain-containing protein [Limnochorda sp. L945t]WRP16895.1 DUF3084 domain-containing protein [Limnochorda sp. L945t]